MVLPWVDKYKNLELKLSRPLNFIKRDILRELNKYSLQSVFDLCTYQIASGGHLAKWIPYLIMKWKFIATDSNREFRSGRVCSLAIIEKWGNMIWRSSADIESVPHFMRLMVDTQIIWQKEYLQDVFFFPGFISQLNEDNPVRKHVLSYYQMNMREFGIFVAMLFMFRKDHEKVLQTAIHFDPKIHQKLVHVVNELTEDWKDITGTVLDKDLNFDQAFAKYLAEIQLDQATFESTESPWMELHPILRFGNDLLFSLDDNLWQRRISNYFYEKLGQNLGEDSGEIGNSFEFYCKKLITPFFTKYRVIDKLPSKTKNADMLTEDDEYFYIFEIKHKKYDPKLFSLHDAKKTSKQLENQVISGYRQVKATAENIDNKRGIFDYPKKPIDKKRIGFVVTERSYLIGSGSKLPALIGTDHLIHNNSIKDEDIYFIGMQELELLLIASREHSVSLASVVEKCYAGGNPNVDLRDIRRFFPIATRTLAMGIMDRSLETLADAFGVPPLTPLAVRG